MESPSQPDPPPGIHPSPLPVMQARSSVPGGYRQGIITAITVMLGFTLAFFRFWGFEAPGVWTYKSVMAAVGLAVAALLQLIALFRAVRLEDDNEAEYRKTTRWFFASATVLVASLLLATIVFSGVF